MFIGAGSGFYNSNPEGVRNNRWIRFNGHSYLTVEDPDVPGEYYDLHFGGGGYDVLGPDDTGIMRNVPPAGLGVPLIGMQVPPSSNRHLIDQYREWERTHPKGGAHKYTLWPNNCWSASLRDFLDLTESPFPLSDKQDNGK